MEWAEDDLEESFPCHHCVLAAANFCGQGSLTRMSPSKYQVQDQVELSSGILKGGFYLWIAEDADGRGRPFVGTFQAERDLKHLRAETLHFVLHNFTTTYYYNTLTGGLF